MQPATRLSLSTEQTEGARFLASRRCAMLADAPGVGKTAQIVRACELTGARSVLGIVPNRTLAVNTAREFSKWGLWRVPCRILESEKDKPPAGGLLLTTYAMAIRPRVRKMLRARAIDALFCDEAHALKETSSQRANVIVGEVGYAHNARNVWFATGTPAPNHAGELFVFATLSGVWAGNYAAWVDAFCIEIKDGFSKKIVGTKNHAQLKALLAPVYLRRDKVEGRPPLHITELAVEGSQDPYDALTPEDRYLVENAIALGDMSFADVPALASVRRLTGLAKAPGVADLVAADLEGGYGKLLVFCQHTDVIDDLARRLAKYKPYIFDGRTPQKKRLEIYDSFQTESANRPIIAQIQAAGEGLTFTAANRVYLAEPSWTPKDNEQAIARAWRRGQQKPVHASYVLLSGSLDEKISGVLKRKSADIAQIL